MKNCDIISVIVKVHAAPGRVVLSCLRFALRTKQVLSQMGKKNFFFFCISMHFRAFWVDWDTLTFLKIFVSGKRKTRASAKRKARGSKATKNVNAKHEARGSELMENASAKHKAGGSEAIKNVSAKCKARGSEATE